MILKGNRRGGAMQMALHLLNGEDNEHVTIHETRGFISESLTEALTEAYAISRGTSCKKFLYSLSLSPPETESVSIEVFEKAIEAIEQKLGFSGQPRAIVFHEKEGRRHAHCIWSRIDVQEMKAIDPSFDKLALRDMSRELYLEHDWKMPRGLMDSEERDPLNFTMAEWQQAKRHNLDPRTIKKTIQECWAVADTRNAFATVLQERGYYLAKGDRRNYVVVDWRGEVHSVARMIDRKSKEVSGRLGDCSELPDVEQTKAKLAENFSDKLQEYSAEVAGKQSAEISKINERKKALTVLHRHDRSQQKNELQQRWTIETAERSNRLPRGLKALWFRVTGKYKAIKLRNEIEAKQAAARDCGEIQALIDRQLTERRGIQLDIRFLRHKHIVGTRKLNRDMAKFLKFGSEPQSQELLSNQQSKHRRRRCGPRIE